MSAADLYVFPSRNEGFPVAPLEVMASGLPVVATNAPGIADIFTKGEESGGIVVPKEDKEALAVALMKLLNDKEKARMIGQRGAERIKKLFSLQAAGAQLKEFIFSTDNE